ncbi:MAG: hypothetical protein KBT12_01795 [Bacteroidales bacterium]|nr:hypothetical protein [Candidatus Physcousia equi]
MMKISNHIRTKIILLITLLAGWAGNAWGAPFEPSFELTYNPGGHWYYIKFTNAGYYMYNNGTGANVGITTTAPLRTNKAYWWQAIGNKNGFILVNGNGQYLKLSASGGNNGFYQPQEGKEGAANLCLDQFSNGTQDVWEIKNLDIASGRCHMNPQSNSISHWNDNDNGNRVIFEVIPAELQASPAPSDGKFSSSTVWFTMKNERSNSFMSTADAYYDTNGLKLRQANQSVTPTEDVGYWCFVLKEGTTDQYYIYNRAAGPDKVLGTKYNGSDANARSKLYDGLDPEDGVGKVYQIGTSNSGYWIRCLGDNGTSNWFIDDSKKTYFTAWNHASNPKTSDGNRFYIYPADIAGIILDESDYTLTPANGEVGSLRTIRIEISKEGYEIKSAAQAIEEGEDVRLVLPTLSSSQGIYEATDITPTGEPGVYDITFDELPNGNYTLTIPTGTFYVKSDAEVVPIEVLSSSYALVAFLTGDVKLVFQDNHGNPITAQTVIYTPETGSPVSLSADQRSYDFGNVSFQAQRFTVEEEHKILTVEFDSEHNQLTFIIAIDPNIIQLSPEPVDGAWADDTKWFLWRSNRSNQNAHNRHYLSTSADWVDDNCYLAPASSAMPSDRGGYWAFVGDNTNGFNIYNNAYGPDFILAYLGNNNYKMVPKDEVPTGAQTIFTHDVSTVLDGASHGYTFRIGTSGINHIHYTNSTLTAWNNGSNGHPRNDDTGSSFMLTYVEDADLSLLTAYDVYKVQWMGASVSDFNISYNETDLAFGKRGSVQEGDYLIVRHGSSFELTDFSTSGSTEYALGKVSTKAVAGHAYKSLQLFIKDALATDEWTVHVNGDNSVIFAGIEYADGASFFARPTTNLSATDFRILAAEDQFVWGPFIDKNTKTITYEVRERATEITSGLYQLQLLDNDANITALSNRIKEEEGNINTSANTLYLVPSLYDTGNDKMFKATGVPRYAGEASTFVFITHNGGDNYSLTNIRTGETITSGGFSFADGCLTKSSGWSFETTAHPLEGPYLQSSGNSSMSFAVHPVDATQYTICQILIEGDGATASTRLQFKNSDIIGSNTVGHGGYLMLNEDSNIPMRSQVSVQGATASISAFTIGDKQENGVTPITIRLTQRQTYWRIQITGEAKTDEDRVTYNGINYVDEALVPLASGSVPTALDFKTNVSDRFVWGPIIDAEAQTITFDIRTRPDDIEEGWYQIQLLDAAKINSVNTRIAAITGAINTRSNYIYVLPLYNNSTTTLAKFGGIPTYADEPASYFYIRKEGSALIMQSPDGRYFRDGAAENGVATPQNITHWNYNNRQLQMGGWTAPGFWTSTAQGSIGVQGPNVAAGSNSSYYEEHYITRVDAASKYAIYQVDLSSANQNKVRYVGSNCCGTTEAYNHGYFFLEKDAVPTKENFRFDGNVSINSISISDANVITFDVEVPTYDHEIIHRQAKYYDYLESDNNQPGVGFIRESDGWMERMGTDGELIREQNVAVFKIPIYLKPGDTTAFPSYLPTNELGAYQRWYDWDTDGMVDDGVLITPSRSSVGTSNQYNNGHLSANAKIKPTFKLPENLTSYNVGLDISRLTDGQTYTSGSLNGSRLEPTLAMRVVYQIRNATDMAADIQAKTDANEFLEVHNISFPNVKHGTYEDKTISNLLPLDLDLNNYWVFDVDENGATTDDLLQLKENGDLELIVSLAEGSVGLQHVMKIPASQTRASGNIQYSDFNTGHFILFQYPDGGEVPSGSKATINVYLQKRGSSQRYNLAQFNLTFIGNSEPIPVTNLTGSYRHPDALLESFGAPVAELNFDNKVNEEYTGCYKYPLDFKGVSYAYGNKENRDWFAGRGEYALETQQGTTGGIVNTYYPVKNYLRNMGDVNAAVSNSVEPDNYFLYIDAADQPGKVASISLDGSLCAGSRMYCYGYIGCTSGGTQYYGNTNQNPTSILINVMGIDKDTHEEVLIYSYCPGIISSRGYDKDGRTVFTAALGRNSVYENHSGDSNYWALWQQVGFSFFIDANTALRMNGYNIQIVNNAWNSTGADTVLDDFQIYLKKPGAEVQNTTPLCSDQIRHIKVITEYATLLDAANEDEKTPGLARVGFCFLDKDVYDRVLEENADKDADHGYDRKDPENKYNMAFNEALMGNRTLDTTNKDHAFHNFSIIRDGELSTIDGETKVRYYEDIPQYSFKESDDDKVYRDIIRGERYIIFKESVAHGEPSSITNHKWTAGKSYYLLFSTAPISQEHVNTGDLGCSVFNLDDSRCAVLHEFTVAPPVTIKGDVEEIVSGDEVQACAGQTATLSVNLNARTDTHDIILKNLNYDWWMPSPTHVLYEMQYGVPRLDDNGNPIPVLDDKGLEQVKTYNTVPATMQNYMNVTWGTYSADHTHLDKKQGEPIYLCDALKEFRIAYPHDTSLVDVVPVHRVGDTEECELTQDLIDCIAHFLEPDESGFSPLTLSRKEMNLVLGSDVSDANRIVHFVVIPIAPSIYSADEDAIYCPDPQELKVVLTSAAPTLANGFDSMGYPEQMNSIPFRIGLKQINGVRQRATGKKNTLSVPLRKAAFAYPEVGAKLMRTLDTQVYLVGSNDPAYKRMENISMLANENHADQESDIEDMFVSVGTIESLAVQRGAAHPVMQITFDNSTIFREGYTYSLKIRFYEVMVNNERDMACEGSFVFDMKVVPEYQVWTGKAGNNDWTNDLNWARADRNELHAGVAATGDKLPGATALDDAVSYASNHVNTTSNSFVPMYFTNVLFPKDATTAPVLYKGDNFKRPTEDVNFLEGLNETATPGIVFDMQAIPILAAGQSPYNYDCNYECVLFDTYSANGLAFEPNTQLGNAHLLDYNKAWVEYELEAGKWYTLGSPLQQSFAGDWYSPTAGAKQLTPHFYGINFSEALNDRYRPAYYQRSWDQAGNNVVYMKSGSTYDSFVKADWSHVYNDAQVDYTHGGFSVKPELNYMEPTDRPADNKVLVRMPKADTSYAYYDIEGETGNAQDALLGSRLLSHRLLSDHLGAEGDGRIQLDVANQTPDNNYLLLSNPFMAALDMDAFLAAHQDQLEAAYWIVDANKQDASIKTDDMWMTTGTTDGRYVAPLKGFFVKTKKGANGNTTNKAHITYTPEMQTVRMPATTPPPTDLDNATRANTECLPNIIRLKAERDGAQSQALIMIDERAHDAFVAGEDCEALVDGNLYDVPNVYTSAGNMAQSINVRQSLNMVPLGIISSKDSEATLHFDLSQCRLTSIYLYDKIDQSYTELSNGSEVSMSGNNQGRYFLTTAIDDLPEADAQKDLQHGVWTTSGIYCGTSTKGLQPGLYIVDGVRMIIR